MEARHFCFKVAVYSLERMSKFAFITLSLDGDEYTVSFIYACKLGDTIFIC